MKVTLNNFQILEGENTFEFNTGINVVVGPNASGKSSMFYGIENALTNPSGVDDCINYNHKQTTVTIENKGKSITWKRQPGSSTYIDNNTGATFVKASKLDSRDLADLGFYFDSKNRVVNIHNEWSVLFPFGESDTDMFRLFEDIFNISSSFQVIDEMKKDEQLIKSFVTQNQSEKTSLQNRLTTLETVLQKIDLDTLNEHISNINEYYNKASELEEDYNNFSKNYLYKNVVLPQVYDVSQLYEKYMSFQNMQKDYEQYIQLRTRADIVLPKLNLDISLPVFDNQLQIDYEQYCLTKANINELKQEYNKLEQEKVQILDKIKQIKVCPTCGKPMEQ